MDHGFEVVEMSDQIKVPDETLGDQRLSSVLKREQEGEEPDPGIHILRAQCATFGLSRRHFGRTTVETEGCFL